MGPERRVGRALRASATDSAVPSSGVLPSDPAGRAATPTRGVPSRAQPMDSSAVVEQRLERLERAVAELADRLAVLETTPPVVARPLDGAPQDAAPFATTAALQGAPALVGRTCLVLGGAFLIRALTESGVLSRGFGVTLGVVYALVWLLLADRAAAVGEALSGAFHALASALIVYPVVFEASTHLGLLTPAIAAILLGTATVLGLFVAWRRAFHTIAWITVVAALGSGVLLLFRTRAALPFLLFLLALALGSLLLAYGRGWRGQRWLVAIVLDGVVLILSLSPLFGETLPEWLSPGAVLLAQLGLVAVYLGAFVLRLLVQGRDVTPFAIAQTALVLLIGFEGALRVGGETTRTAIAVGALLCGALLHMVLARRSERRFGHGVAVGYFSTLATFLAAEATRLLLPSSVYPLLWALAAVVLAVLALSGERPILQVHAALLTVAAAIASRLLPAALVAFVGAADGDWPGFTTTPTLVLLLAVATAGLLYRGAPRAGRDWAVSVARTTTLVVVLAGLGGLACCLLRAALGAEAGRLAVIRSAVLALAAVLLAAGRLAIGRLELGRLAAAVLVLGGLKLLLEDLRWAEAGHLVVSLSFYGTALIVVSALGRRVRGRREAPAPPG